MKTLSLEKPFTGKKFFIGEKKLGTPAKAVRAEALCVVGGGLGEGAEHVHAEVCVVPCVCLGGLLLDLAVVLGHLDLGDQLHVVQGGGGQVPDGLPAHRHLHEQHPDRPATRGEGMEELVGLGLGHGCIRGGGVWDPKGSSAEVLGSCNDVHVTTAVCAKAGPTGRADGLLVLPEKHKNNATGWESIQVRGAHETAEHGRSVWAPKTAKRRRNEGETKAKRRLNEG